MDIEQMKVLLESKLKDFNTKRKRFKRLFNKWEKQTLTLKDSKELNNLYVELEQLDEELDLIGINILFKNNSENRKRLISSEDGRERSN